MRVLTYDAVVIGSGAAGYNAAARLAQFGKRAAIVTEGVTDGTSRNTGSDKQTYYKLSLGGDTHDGVKEMAADLFGGQSVDGDTALCEAALSARCFLHLCELGVPFPVNGYGEYIGYQTDNDVFCRATSAGPLTSRLMTEALQAEASRYGVSVYDGYLAIEILVHEGRACGVLCLQRESGELTAFRCADVVLATGGPAGIYADSVYPVGHTGSTSLALNVCAVAQNLTEWQYGLSSVSPRWNVSGTYMQVLPRFVSVDAEGEEHEFLTEFFADEYEALSTVFLKGYQWPFDCERVDGSSVIDLLVYRETCVRNRRVFLDFSKNPFDLQEINYLRLSSEACKYLDRAGACFGTPIDRLQAMNAPAVELYRSKGVDLRREYLEIALCAQHHNGGIAVDAWWQTTVPGLFAVGECAGTHGASRPGGAALNAGQVGSLRAAQYIAANGGAPIGDAAFETVLAAAEQRHEARPQASAAVAEEKLNKARRRMSRYAAAFRDEEQLRKLLVQTLEEQKTADGKTEMHYRLRDCLITQAAVLTAMLDYARTVRVSRGSALYYSELGNLRSGLDEDFRFLPDDYRAAPRVQEVAPMTEGFGVKWRHVRPLPKTVDVFERVWREYREPPVK